MRVYAYVALAISVVVLLGVRIVSASAKDIPCSDLRTAKVARLLTSLLGFSHGTGCYPEDAEDEPDSKECDWKVTVAKDRKIGNDRRLVVVGREHMTGSGGWADLTVFGCRSGKVAVVFSDTSRGDEIEQASADRLVFGGPKWADKDPQCCPSLEERKVYLWNNEKQTYVLDHKESFPIKKP